jgi:hypothetical protein
MNFLYAILVKILVSQAFVCRELCVYCFHNVWRMGGNRFHNFFVSTNVVEGMKRSTLCFSSETSLRVHYGIVYVQGDLRHGDFGSHRVLKTETINFIMTS